jgi:hypothetical protein
MIMERCGRSILTLHAALRRTGSPTLVILILTRLLPQIERVLSVNDHLCVITTCRCGDKRNYGKAIKRMLDKSLHLRW